MDNHIFADQANVTKYLSDMSSTIAGQSRQRKFEGLCGLDQWTALAETPRLMRWWHFIALTIDNLVAGIVYGWAWFLAGASWRILPAVAYSFLGTLISVSVLFHGPASKVTQIGPFMGICQV